MGRTVKDEFPPLGGYDPEDAEACEAARKHPANPQADPTPVLGGVTVAWLATVFRTSHVRVKQLLRGVPPVRVSGHGPLYDISVAAQYMVLPKASVEDFLRLAKRADLPVGIQHQFWSAMQKRQKYEMEARQLWRTEDVLDVLGDTAKEIRSSIMLWTDDVDRAVGLTKAQRASLRAQSDHLLKAIHRLMVEKPHKESHPASVSEIPALMASTEAAQGDAKAKKPGRKPAKRCLAVEDEDLL